MNIVDYEKPEVKGKLEALGYSLPSYDRAAVVEKTSAEPTWIHFGAGNIFRAYQADILETALRSGAYDRGVIVAEAFDYDLIDRSYRAFDNLSVDVILHGDGRIEKKIIGSVTESLKADRAFPEDMERLKEIFRNPSLQQVSFSVTEKGYGHPEEDAKKGPYFGGFLMEKITALVYERFLAGAFPLALQSMDNCSHNGDKVKEALLYYAETWVKEGFVPQAFYDYVSDPAKVSCPWSMIDRIVPRPDPMVEKLLIDDGLEGMKVYETERHSFSAGFVNCEETGYLVIEDSYPNGHPPLDFGGAVYTDRTTVDKVERMKVCTCLNPVHTAIATIGCILGCTLVYKEMEDPDIQKFTQRMVYEEAMPVVTDPGIIDPKEFADTVLNVRLTNPYIPDTVQRIAVDNSATFPIRFGETIKNYIAEGLDLDKLNMISLTLASYARYLRGINDAGEPFTPSPDPMNEELMAIVAGLDVKEGEQDFSCLKQLFSRADIFGVDLYTTVLGEKVENIAKKLFAGPGAVRRTLHETVEA